MEPTVKYQLLWIVILTCTHESGSGTVAGGQFDWGGRLLKSNGGAQRYSQHGWKSCIERKGRKELDCEDDNPNRCESRT